ncbi:MAG: hypothetical protein ACTSQB_02220, partial [Candidatus Heimdallarchaeota archaeon]
GKVDTKIEIEKFQLYERIIIVFVASKEVRSLTDEHFSEMSKEDKKQLVQLLKDVSIAGKLVHYSLKALYDNYDLALENVEELNETSNRIIEGLFNFKYCDQEGCEISFDKPEVLIGNALRSVLQNMINVGDKIINIVRLYSYHHDYLKLDDEKEEESSDEKEDSKSIEEMEPAK